MITGCTDSNKIVWERLNQSLHDFFSKNLNDVSENDVLVLDLIMYEKIDSFSHIISLIQSCYINSTAN